MDSVWTIKDILEWAKGYLAKHHSTTPRLDAELLLANALNCERIDLYCQYGKPVTTNEKLLIRGLFKRRASGEPVAYILGKKDFYGHTFEVDSRVLIPRPETEHLIEAVLSSADCFGKDCSVLDIGTGSGAVALSLSLERPLWDVVGWDVCSGALEVANRNKASMRVDNVELIQGDALNAETWVNDTKKYQVICSNPPYIAEDEVSDMSQSVIDHEPKLALFAKKNGLEFYDAIANYARGNVEPGGYVFVEIGWKQSESVSDIFRQYGWSVEKVHRDLAGHPRVVEARMNM